MDHRQIFSSITQIVYTVWRLEGIIGNQNNAIYLTRESARRGRPNAQGVRGRPGLVTEITVKIFRPKRIDWCLYGRLRTAIDSVRRCLWQPVEHPPTDTLYIHVLLLP